MNTLTREDLFSLEAYSTERQAFRAKVLDHKAHRRVTIGKNATCLLYTSPSPRDPE